VLGKYVREEHALSLMDALRKMTLAPAQRLQDHVPSMAQKGRLRAGADADITIFDPAMVIDKSTYEDATIPAAGIPYVIVGGRVAVDSGKVTTVRAGRAIRAPIRQP
jgi:dihydroorotase